MTEDQKARIERCAQLCEWSLAERAAFIAKGMDQDWIDEAADAASFYADQAFAIAVPTGDHWHG